MEDPSITIARFIRGLRPNFRQNVIFSSPFILDEAYRKALEVEILNKVVPMRHSTLPTRPPTQLVSKATQFSTSASNTKASSLPVSSKSTLSTSASASRTPADYVVQCFSCCGRGHYVSECSHHTLAVEHEPTKCEDETAEPEGSC